MTNVLTVEELVEVLRETSKRYWNKTDFTDLKFSDALKLLADRLEGAHEPHELTVRDNPIIDDRKLREIFETNGGWYGVDILALRAVWRHGVDTGMVAP